MAPRLDQRRGVLDFMPVANARPLLVLSLGGVKMAPHGMPVDDQQFGQYSRLYRDDFAAGSALGRDVRGME